jgi:hypothetical protein
MRLQLGVLRGLNTQKTISSSPISNSLGTYLLGKSMSCRPLDPYLVSKQTYFSVVVVSLAYCIFLFQSFYSILQNAGTKIEK